MKDTYYFDQIDILEIKKNTSFKHILADSESISGYIEVYFKDYHVLTTIDFINEVEKGGKFGEIINGKGSVFDDEVLWLNVKETIISYLIAKGMDDTEKIKEIIKIKEKPIIIFKEKENNHMKYDIIVRKVDATEESSLRGFATVTFGNSFKVDNIRILESKENGLFVSYPSYKKGEEYVNIVEGTQEFNPELKKAILDVYNEAYEPTFSVRLSVVNNESQTNLKALATITLDHQFSIGGIKIMNGDKGLFVAMPQYKTNKMEGEKPVYEPIAHPLTATFREKLFAVILDTYEKEKKAALEVTQVQSKSKSQASLSK